LSHSNVKLNKLETWQYPTPAKRPKNSTLNLEKFKIYIIFNLKTGKKVWQIVWKHLEVHNLMRKFIHIYIII
jgi:dTDP-4-dehydrorhamnose reductase